MVVPVLVMENGGMLYVVRDLARFELERRKNVEDMKWFLELSNLITRKEEADVSENYKVSGLSIGYVLR